MSGTPPKSVYKVELFVEVTVSTSHPKEWNWDLILNDGVRKSKRTPVQFVLAHQVQEGNT